MRRLKLWAIIAAAALVAGSLFIALAHHAAKRRELMRGVTTTSIPVSGGVHLAAEVVTPQTSGRHPLVVMPTSWGAEETQYEYVARLFADAGFQVVAYTQRGFTNSGGVIDFAGPVTVADASTVIDWALKHTDADPDEIGMLGDSYGAGVSLLAAERDPRIKAVTALSTWTDWGYSFAPNDTVSVQALHVLMTVGASKGRLGPDLTRLNAVYATDPSAAVTLIDQLAATRSPIDGVAALNKNKTAVLLANGEQDSIFAPQQLVTFYDKLTGPRRLQLAVGDHTQAELQGFLGKKVGPVADALEWMSHYLLGTANGIDTAAPIQLEDAATLTTHSYQSWPAADSTRDLPLPDGAVNAGHVPGRWTSLIATGIDTQAHTAPETVNLTAPYRFATANVAGIPTTSGLRWSSPEVTAPQTISGTPKLTMSVASTGASATFFAYLYDVSGTGLGTLMSTTPETITGLASGTPRSVSLDLTPVAWTLAAGHHLALVVDTVDARWSTRNAAGTTLAFSSPAALSLPEPS
ncbi:alpha/beta fold hydrolase [Jatrophihabitans sp.]|uniref:alpha/beta fold hydrolase n=1 Tax=Jatrophihabitans sp. TaxID=1932789 RepID=UPI0030C6C018